MKQLCLVVCLLLPGLSFAQQYSYGEKISIRSGGALTENANAAAYDVSGPNHLFYVGSEEFFGPLNGILPATARINYRVRASSGPTTGAFASLPITGRTVGNDMWFYRGQSGDGCNCSTNLDLFGLITCNGTFTLDVYLSVTQTNGDTFSGKPQYIVFTVTGKPSGPPCFPIQVKKVY